MASISKSNGGGKTVRIKHTSGYESEYMHLSAIGAGMHVGARVGQGDLVGLVGSTGLASGPHLHYGLRRDGNYVNPITEHQNLPPGEPSPAHPDRAGAVAARQAATTHHAAGVG